MYNWHIGQKIVCIIEPNEWSLYGEPPKTYPVKGKVYTVWDVHTSVKFPAHIGSIPYFTIAEFGKGSNLFSHLGFRPLEEKHTEIFRSMVTPEALKKFKEPGPLQKALERVRESR